MIHPESHKSQRTGWLRAAVLGANDGIVSTGSLLIGVASANSSIENVLIAGVAGLVAGAMSMAAGEYVSVSSQADTEQADLRIERRSLEENYAEERAELAEIYQTRGVTSEVADEVARQLMAFDALGAHARDEIGINQDMAKPLQAALASAASFTVGASLPLGTTWFAPTDHLVPVIALVSLISLALLGALSAHAGGAPKLKAIARVTFWGGLAMAATAAVGSLFGLAV